MVNRNILPPQRNNATAAPVPTAPRTEAPAAGAVTTRPIPAAHGMPEGLEVTCAAPELGRRLVLTLHLSVPGCAAWMKASLWLEGPRVVHLLSTLAHPLARRPKVDHWHLSTPGQCPALMLGELPGGGYGDVRLDITRAEHAELARILAPHGLEGEHQGEGVQS